MAASLLALLGGYRNILHGDRAAKDGDATRALVLRCAGSILLILSVFFTGITILLWGA